MHLATPMQYHQPPGLWSQYVRALLARGNGKPVPPMPSLEATLIRQRCDPAKVAEYAKVCGFNQHTYLPYTYPHILAFPLHLELMLHPEFPLAPMGLVHVRNQITQHRPIAVTEALDIRCFLGASQHSDKGLEFDCVTEVRVMGELVWESVSTNLARSQTASSKKKTTPPTPAAFDHQQSWHLPSNLGRRYARVSGDSNPIHLYPFSARLFGFKQHIAHGMWTKARTAAALTNMVDMSQGQLTVQFKQPIFLPADIALHYQPEGSNVSFDVRAQDSRIHMTGHWQGH